MKIVNWNCNGKFRKKFNWITNEKFKDTYVDADIFVIQECEDPEKEVGEKVKKRTKENFKKYKKWAGKKEENYFWIGNEDKNKGLGIFAKGKVKLEKIGEWDKDIKYFLAVRVNDSFNLLGVWAMEPYVKMIHDFLDAYGDNEELFDKDLIICGDFNSNPKWDKDHKYEDGREKNHTALNKKLKDKGLCSVYHCVTGEKPKKETKVETKNTFFSSRYLNTPDHLDYFYANKKCVKNTKWRGDKKKANKNKTNEFEILEKWQWISMSDHLPLVLNIRKKLDFESEYVLHRLTQEKLKDLFGLCFLASERQYKISEDVYDELKLGDIGFDENGKELTIRVDNIAYDKNKEELVIIKNKNKKNSKVLKQAEKYLKVVNKYPNVFNERKYNEFGKKEEKSIHYSFENIRVMIIAPEFDPIHKKEHPDNFDLWEVSLWDKRNNNEGEVIYKKLEKGSKKGVTKKKVIDLSEVKLTEKDVIENNVPEDKREEICALYCSFKEKVNYEDIVLRFLTNGVSFRVNNKIICIVYFNKNSIKFHYNTDELVCPIFETNKCELCSKNRTNREHDCPEDKTNRDLGCLRNIKCKDYVGNYELILNSEEDIDFAFELFKQVYKEKRRNRK